MTHAGRPPAGPLQPPVFETSAQYADRLGDAAYWEPFVREILARHNLPDAPLEVGEVGSFPTFLVGQYVVKLFGERFEGAVCFQSEQSVLGLLQTQPAIPAPVLIAEGALVDAAIDADRVTPPLASRTGRDWPWPYLVMTRLPGTAWHQARLDETERHAVARQLGASIRQLHDLPPDGPFWARDWLAEFRKTCVERQRRYGCLPAHLIDQIDGYLIPPLPDRRLTHADLHDHHLLVDGNRLVGIVDWGDALVADPHYELPALHLHTFNADRRLLASFLDGYGWRPDADFARRAMTMTLIYPFCVLDRVARSIDFGQVASLAALAALIWGRP